MVSKMKLNDGRVDFGSIAKIMDIPYLLATQMQSYNDFLQIYAPPDSRENKGLQEVFDSIFPVKASNNNSSLEFVDYTLGTPKYDSRECIERGMTYAAPLKVKLQLIVREKSEETGEIEVRDIKEQDIYMGEIPLMTEQGTFIINGAERVIVSQLHRSPGVSFGSSTQPGSKITHVARIIPYRGAWVEFEVDSNNIMYVTIDRKRRILVTTFLRAFGLQDDEELAHQFFNTKTIDIKRYTGGTVDVSHLHKYLNYEFVEDVNDEDSGKRIIEKGTKIAKRYIEKLKDADIKSVVIMSVEDATEVIGTVIGEDIVDKTTGEIIAECWERVTTFLLRKCALHGVKKIAVLDIDDPESDIIFSTIAKDKIRTYEDALLEFFRRMRPGNPISVGAGRRLLDEMFFNEKRYDLGAVGRYKINKVFKTEPEITSRLLTEIDIVNVIKHLSRIQKENIEVDDIDHLGNRRVRSVGELLQNQIRLGLADLERTARERMNIVDLENLLPHNLINAKPVISQIKDFFGRSQLSQFMDQTNPLSELTHKRRLSALGPGGLSRDRAGFEVRDVHHTHYGRICPIETPEGPNIGLISSLCTYAKINEYGFIETPYRKVENGRVTNKVEYLSADTEDEYIIAQANAPVDEKGNFINEFVKCRYRGDFPVAEREKVDYMDVSPMQLVSVSAALIPFLEHDDANRALMGSNMQRQSVPLLFTEFPIVGTGIEKKVARDSGVCVIAKNDGTVKEIAANKIVVTADNGLEDVYYLSKFIRSNQNTCVNQRPIVSVNDRVKAGTVIADGPSTREGELALGKNVLVAFMSWGGYNFEDAILISERLVKDDIYTSIHIEEFEIDARDTKLGREEITKDIPNVNEEALTKLDSEGIINIGSRVKPGDILVGKVTPKGETELSSEEKLLRAIFGEKAGDVRDASLKVPPGIEGIVIDVKVFSRKERGTVSNREDKQKITKIEEEKEQQINDIINKFTESLKEILKTDLVSDIVDFETGKVLMKPGGRLNDGALAYVKNSLGVGMLPVDGKCGKKIKELYQRITAEKVKVEENARNKIDRIKTGDELPPGVIKLVKVYVATKRKLSVGDKMAGRHGNKGVIAKVLPEGDMPFLEDGTPVDLVLNPLGVPSRMNVGQILETHLGWAAKILGMRVSSPVFNGASENEIKELMKKAGIGDRGQVTLYDGLTGEPFDNPVTVGQIYMLKLAHLVEDKMHARAIGPYSLVTQQPLGGKAQFGGQRFGEMEVWALEAYGAAYTLQEMLTVKSDDVEGRTKMYESIVKGENFLKPGVPESFNVLVKELQSLALSMELITEEELKEEEEIVRTEIDDIGISDEDESEEEEEFAEEEEEGESEEGYNEE